MPETSTETPDRQARALLRTTSDHRNGSLGLGIEVFALRQGSVCSRKSPLASRYLSAEKPVDDDWAPRRAGIPATAEVSIVIGKPIPRLDGFLSRDGLCYDTNRLLGIGPCLPSQPPIRS